VQLFRQRGALEVCVRYITDVVELELEDDLNDFEVLLGAADPIHFEEKGPTIL
jgi:hypothetical protein